jgi:hypothetical protein
VFDEAKKNNRCFPFSCLLKILDNFIFLNMFSIKAFH